MITSIAAPRLAAAPAAQHPAVDWWTVGAVRFDSTRDLVDKVQTGNDGLVARYHYYTKPGDNDPAKLKADMYKAMAGSAVGGAVMGGLFGGGILGAGAIAIYILSAGFIQPDTTAIPIMAGLCAVGGAFMGAASARESAKFYATEGRVMDGTIRSEKRTDGDHLIFYRGDTLSSAVDLNDYANGGAGASGGPWWKAGLA